MLRDALTAYNSPRMRRHRHHRRRRARRRARPRARAARHRRGDPSRSTTRGRVAEGKALDIMQAAPIEGFATAVSGSTRSRAAGGRSARRHRRSGRRRRMAGRGRADAAEAADALAPAAVDPVRRRVAAGARRSRRARTAYRPRTAVRHRARSARGGARALVALAIDGSPRDVALSVLGVPPAHIVVPWDDATSAGSRLTRLIDEPTRRRLAAGSRRSGRRVRMRSPRRRRKRSARCSAGHAPVVSCFVAPDDAAGHRRARRHRRAARIARRLSSRAWHRTRRSRCRWNALQTARDARGARQAMAMPSCSG